MFDIDKWSEIFQTLSRNKSRSFLTAFGVFWGVFMLVLLMGGAKGMKAMMESNFDGFAQNSYLVTPASTSKPYSGFRTERTWQLDLADIDLLRRHIPEIDVITPTVFTWTDIKYRNRTLDGTVKGVRPDYTKVENPRLAHGRYIQANDLHYCRKVCVIGKNIATQLFPNTDNPIGRFIEAEGIYYQIVGVSVLDNNVGIGGPPQYSIYVPFTTLQRLHNRPLHPDLIAITVRPGHSVSTIQPQVESLLKSNHRIAPDDAAAVRSINMEAMFQMVQSLFDGINILVWLIGIGTLLSGSIGVSNIMMVVVKERTTEIGIRRAIGARPVHILSQILTESAILTILAGLSGIVAAVLILATADKGIGAHSTTVPPGSFLISFPMAVGAAVALSLLGSIAGIAPALRALAVKPIDAIRDE